MDNTLLKGIWKYMMPVPPFLWQRQIRKMGDKARARTAFMTADHHRVRNFVVKALPFSGAPLAPAAIAENAELPLAKVNQILDDLEREKFFLFRNENGEVVWAYPVTADPTPHRATFPDGEQIFAA